MIVTWANTIDAANSIISAQHFQIGAGADIRVVDSGSAIKLESLPSSPSAPVLVPPTQAVAPKILATVEGNNADAPDFPEELPPKFPQPATITAAIIATSTQADVQSAPATPGGSIPTSVQANAVNFGINRFPTRASLRSGLTTPGQAATSALQRMAAQRQQISNGSFSSMGNRMRNVGYGGGQSTASLSRATLINSTLQNAAANTFKRPGVRSGAYPGVSSLAARNSGGIGAVRALSGHSDMAAGIRSGTAQNRFELMRQQAQNASSKLVQARPVGTSLQQQGTQMNLQWQGRSGTRYQVQGSNDQVNWQNHGHIRSGSNANSALVDRSYRYYRVIERN